MRANRGRRPARRTAAARVWALSVIWLHHHEPERPQVVVVFVDAATGQVMGAAPRAAVTGKAARALPAADGSPRRRYTESLHPPCAEQPPRGHVTGPAAQGGRLSGRGVSRAPRGLRLGFTAAPVTKDARARQGPGGDALPEPGNSPQPPDSTDNDK